MPSKSHVYVNDVIAPPEVSALRSPAAAEPALPPKAETFASPPPSHMDSPSRAALDRSQSTRAPVATKPMASQGLDRSVSTRVPVSSAPLLTPPPVMPKLKEIRSEAKRDPWTPDMYMTGRIARGVRSIVDFDCPSNTQQEAEALLKRSGWTEGLFLVREKGDAFNSLVLSLVHNEQPLHLLLEQKGSDPFTINGEPFGEVCCAICLCVALPVCSRCVVCLPLFCLSAPSMSNPRSTVRLIGGGD
jgi:hypothetical protein